jgi:hypothetical protein
MCSVRGYSSDVGWFSLALKGTDDALAGVPEARLDKLGKGS